MALLTPSQSSAQLKRASLDSFLALITAITADSMMVRKITSFASRVVLYSRYLRCG